MCDVCTCVMCVCLCVVCVCLCMCVHVCGGCECTCGPQRVGESLASDFHPAGKKGNWSPWAGGLLRGWTIGTWKTRVGELRGGEALALALSPSTA